MKTLTLAMVVAIMQAVTPVPRQTANPSTGTHQTVENHAKSNNKEAKPSTPVIEAVSTRPNQNTDADNSHKKDETSVRISQLSRVSVTRDAIDYIGLILTFILLAVGFFGVRAAYRTLRAIESQAGIMRGQLETMQDQVREMRKQFDMMINKERARIMIEIKSVVLDSGPAQVQYTVNCHGPTEAFIKDARVSVEILPSAGMDNSKFGQPMKIPAVMKEATLLRQAYALNNFAATVPHQIENGQLWVHFKAEIAYNDVFGEERSVWLGEVYGATNPPMQNLDGSPFLFWMSGGEAYNRST
jgi:hypothetical protein